MRADENFQPTIRGHWNPIIVEDMHESFNRKILVNPELLTRLANISCATGHWTSQLLGVAVTYNQVRTSNPFRIDAPDVGISCNGYDPHYNVESV